MSRKNDKIKEWILVKYNKKIILNMFNDRIHNLSDIPPNTHKFEYYTSQSNNNIEFEIFSIIFNDIYKKRKKEKNINGIIYFILYYIKIIIPTFNIKNKIQNENQK